MSDSEKEVSPIKEYTPSEAFELLLKHVGRGGKFQWRVFFLTCISGFFFAFHSISAVFLAALPEYKCNVPGITATEEMEKNSTNAGQVWEPKCHYYDTNGLFFDEITSTSNNNSFTPREKICQSWSYDDSVYKSTVVGEWDLVCEKSWMMTFVQASYMGGILAGSLTLSEVSDTYGRRRVSLLAAVGLLISSLATAFTKSFVTFIILRFFVAYFVIGLFIANLVLVMELCGQRRRTEMGILFQVTFAIGICILSVIAFFVRHWRNIQLAISVPSAFLLVHFKLLPESPRWLFCQGREEEALKVLEDIARVNKKRLPEKGELENLLIKVNRPRNPKQSVLGKLTNIFRNQVTLLRTPNLRRRSIVIYYCFFVVSLVYYGIAFNGANLNASVYIMVFVNGVAATVSHFTGSVTVKRYGRRLNIFYSYILSGIFCLLILAVPKEIVWLNVTLSSIGKFFNTIAFITSFVYAAELVPTNVRNLAVGTASMWARVGSISSSFIVDLLGQIHYTIPSTIFGILSVSAGLLVLLLPETGNRPLPETVEEVEALEM